MAATAVEPRPDEAEPRGGAPSTRIAVHGLTKTYTRRDGTTVRAVDDLTLDVDAGEFLVLLGPSGCGKTTLLRSLAGLEDVQAGRIELDGRPVEDSAARVRVPTERRGLSMMFQSYALWPHKTVAQNVEYPLTTRRIDRPERADRVRTVLDAVGVGALAGQYPGALSGGQQQRVALARSLVAGDGIVLFDEPLSNVDARVREQLRAEIRRLHAEIGFTAVYVTHDQEEALTLATRLLVLREGRIAQSGSPAEVYLRPTDAGVARFMGAGNEISGVARGDIVTSDAGDVVGRAMPEIAEGTPVVAFSRPETWCFDPPPAVLNRWTGTVAGTVFLGSVSEHTVVLPGGVRVRVRTLGATGPDVGAEVEVGVPADAVRVLAASGSPS
ncbi:ABC transporter ATP-binding protein [Pseudonocardia sp. KRD291]|uniref:ABC transporter ATP-binding protein n=1 Tax=Pseudonocardia sp. KRD291 TaxID=2792007 RepID=UPI001C4A41B3|nr:ABC transporter ATP-binding protein [Pseudonocardia sp. KRD291]MBW0101876.1 ABC transporter ATP-binding protein [Pseudonocardia sp. KRD291]